MQDDIFLLIKIAPATKLYCTHSVVSIPDIIPLLETVRKRKKATTPSGVNEEQRRETHHKSAKTRKTLSCVLHKGTRNFVPKAKIHTSSKRAIVMSLGGRAELLATRLASVK